MNPNIPCDRNKLGNLLFANIAALLNKKNEKSESESEKSVSDVVSVNSQYQEIDELLKKMATSLGMDSTIPIPDDTPIEELIKVLDLLAEELNIPPFRSEGEVGREG